MTEAWDPRSPQLRQDYLQVHVHELLSHPLWGWAPIIRVRTLRDEGRAHFRQDRPSERRILKKIEDILESFLDSISHIGLIRTAHIRVEAEPDGIVDLRRPMLTEMVQQMYVAPRSRHVKSGAPGRTRTPMYGTSPA